MIRIQSKITITVTAGLQYEDMSNPDAHVPERLKIAPKWTKKTVQIREGVGEYPEEITDWPTVKSLIEDKIITVQGMVEREIQPTNVESVKETEEVEVVKTTRRGKKTLQEVVDEDNNGHEI